MPFHETLGLAIPDHPVEEVERMLLIDGIAGDSDPVDEDWSCRKDNSGGDGEVEVGGEGEACTAESNPSIWDVPTRAEGPVEVSGDAWIDSLVKIDLTLLYLSNLLFLLEQF